MIISFVSDVYSIVFLQKNFFLSDFYKLFFQASLKEAVGPVEGWGAQAWMNIADDDRKFNFYALMFDFDFGITWPYSLLLYFVSIVIWSFSLQRTFSGQL